MTFSFVQGGAPVSGASAAPAFAFAGSTPVGNLVYAVLTQTFGANSPKTITNCRDSVDGAVDYTLLHETHDSASNLYVHVYGRVVTIHGVTGMVYATADQEIMLIDSKGNERRFMVDPSLVDDLIRQVGG